MCFQAAIKKQLEAADALKKEREALAELKRKELKTAELKKQLEADRLKKEKKATGKQGI